MKEICSVAEVSAKQEGEEADEEKTSREVKMISPLLLSAAEEKEAIAVHRT